MTTGILLPLQQLPVDAFHWLLAATPIIALLVLLVVFRWQAPEAASIALFIAITIAVTMYQTPLDTLAVSFGKGVWDAIFVLYVVWPALLIYLITDRAGGFYALRVGIERFSTNELFLVLAFGWVFASFLQGIAGFGTPVAVVAPLLLAFGVKPVFAVAMPLIGHSMFNMFGSLAVTWFVTHPIATDLIAPVETAVQTGILLWVPTLLAGFAIAWLYGRMPAVRHALPLILVVSTIHGAVQLGILVLYDPIIVSGFLAATVALLSLYPLSRWDRYATPHKPFERPAMTETTMMDRGKVATDGGTPAMEDDRNVDEEPEPVMGFAASLLPYAILTIVAMVLLVPPPIEEFLAQFEFGFSFPATETGYLDTASEAGDPYSPFAFLTHPGTIIMAAIIPGYLLYRKQGYFEEWQRVSEEYDSLDEKSSVLAGLIDNGVPASLAIIILVIMAAVMVDSGQIQVLAEGMAMVLPPTLYLFGANGIGLLGTFITSSNTSSNILFVPLQSQSAELLSIPESTVVAAQSTGGAFGNAIAPSNVVLGTGTAGIVGREGDVLRITIPWTIACAVVVGGLTVLLSSFVFMGGA